MRLWTIHPKHLDQKGLVALWRETLLAKNVLLGMTKGYKHHPQLKRFKACENSLAAINRYLSVIYDNAVERGYKFDRTKFVDIPGEIKINVTTGQIEFERIHLNKKLQVRTGKELESEIDVHPIFNIVEGEIESWEILK